jgi:uncharacterized repeat protein (TIGR01451 family)
LRRGIARLAAVSLIAAGFVVATATVAAADSADVASTTASSVVVNADGSVTVTLQGTWTWVSHDPVNCNTDRWGVGWAADWNDPTQPGNLVTTIGSDTIAVGAASANSYNPADNNVHYYQDAPRCGTFPGGSNAGDFGVRVDQFGGFLTHTYPPGTSTINPCVLTYDIHNKTVNGVVGPDPAHLIAGGPNRQKDNSAEQNGQHPEGNVCAPVTLKGNIELTKVFTASPTTVTLKIGTTAGGQETDHADLNGNGTTGNNNVTIGTYYLSEALTDAANYDSDLACADVTGGGNTPVTIGADDSVFVGFNKSIKCTFTNTPKNGSISGSKFNDLNADGSTSGDPKLTGWEIKIFDSTDTVVKDLFTDGSGNYSASLPPGDYRVCEVGQNDWTQSVPAANTACAGLPGVSGTGYAVTVTPNGTFTGKDFGNWTTGAVSGQKWEDKNGNGTKDAGDNGLQNWHIRVFDQNGSQVGSDLVTDVNGNFSVNLNPGTYRICEVLQADWTQSFPNPANTACEGLAGVSPSGYQVTVTSNGTFANKNFGNFTTSVVSGQKWEDKNGNGTKDAGDNGLQGWHIRVFDQNGSQVGSDLVTDVNGNFSVSLNPGTYRICEVVQANWTQSFPNPANTACQGLSGVSPSGYQVTVTSQGSSQGNNFGNFTTGAVSGQKWEDKNANGTKDAGDNGLQGWHIRVFDQNGSQVGSDLVTDSNGNFSVDLNPGTYRICEVVQANWTQSFPHPANTACQGLSGVSPSGYQVTVTSNGTFGSNDFGNWTTGAVSGQKWEDKNANGTKDAGDDGLQGWHIRVFDQNGSQVGSDLVTDSNGNFSVDFNPGTYRICEVLQANWTQSFPNPANTVCQGLSGVSPSGYQVTVTSSGTFPNINFGNWHQGSITITKVAVPQDPQDFAFTTTNLGGPFSLDDDGNNQNALSNTKSFTGLKPGTTYTVTETAVTGWKLTALDCTGLGAGDSAVLATGVTTIALKPGQVVSCTYTNTSPDLGVTKSDNPDPVAAGNQLTYTVTVTNHGPANATGVVVVDHLDPNTTFVSTSLGNACTHVSGVVTCELGDMTNGQVKQFTITVTVHANAPVGTNTLNNKVDVSGDQPDWNPSNNHDEEPTSVIASVDLSIVKTASVGSVDPGQAFSYTLKVDNLGPSDAQHDATVTDVLPADVTFVSFGTLPAGVTCTPPVGRQFTCTIAKGLLEVSDPPVTITVNVAESANPTQFPVTNKVVVSSPDDTAPCTVTSTNITCATTTNNYSEVTVSVVLPAVVVQPIAFTGSDAGRLAGLGALLVLAGGLMLLVTRRRRRRPLAG